jgi:hypothetical protein
VGSEVEWDRARDISSLTLCAYHGRINFLRVFIALIVIVVKGDFLNAGTSLLEKNIKELCQPVHFRDQIDRVRPSPLTI